MYHDETAGSLSTGGCTDRADACGVSGLGRNPERTLVLWCPDWPVVAALREAGLPSSEPAAVVRAGRVDVCTAAARAGGVRRGMRRRDAQSRCPELAIVAADPDRDARLFEPVVSAVEELSPGIDVLRPGLAACRVRGPAGYLGSELAAAERLIDTVEALDVECHIGIADLLEVAVLAARRQATVPPGAEADFCADLPLRELACDPAIAPPEWALLVQTLQRLGITTARALAALPAARVGTRFGAAGLSLYRLASGQGQRGVSARHVEGGIAVEEVCEPPLERVDTAAFLARALADRFAARLTAAGLACLRLAVIAETERGTARERVWRCTRPLTALATADRLRWQLDGWLTVHGRPGAITLLRLEAVETVDAGLMQYGLWGSGDGAGHRARRAFARVQGLLGPEAVRLAVRAGGRGPADRITMAAWGEENIPERDPAAPWPGALPSPAPTCLPAAVILAAPAPVPGIPASFAATVGTAPASTVAVTDRDGRAVTVTDRGLLTGEPAAVDGGQVRYWAGPWLFDERWWEDAKPGPGAEVVAGLAVAPPGRRIRMQVVIDSGSPMLLASGPHGWCIEAVYD